MTEVRDCAKPAEGRREERRQAILDAAESLFLEQGYAGASLAAIVRRSGGSLATVYEMFGSKYGLLRAVVDRNREEGLRGLDETARTFESAADALRLLAYRHHEHVMSPRTIAFARVVIDGSLRDPDFGRSFYRDVHLTFVECLADMFREWAAAGKASIDDPRAAAELYISTVMCNAPIKAMLGQPPEPTDRATIDWRLAPFLAHFSIR
ncbi:MAG TPA: TetR/AcrR family transcriptional regulator [Allosphingosinicella sp.]